MDRRQYVGGMSAVLGSASLAGCAGLLPSGNESENPEYPGGTLLVENKGETAVNVSVTVSTGKYDAALDASVASGETVVRREFITAERGDIVTLAAQLGTEGEPIEFQYLPAGSDDDSSPEVARLTFENPVETSATWTAIRGT
ncbi:hypothetical protein [Halobaculum rarum]|uniref:hypothetical protein n=1 Tax=Halobaculum rarum TaxID=3075122 RepID=UPI0032AED72D